jgi:hypothetical protein
VRRLGLRDPPHGFDEALLGALIELAGRGLEALPRVGKT